MKAALVSDMFRRFADLLDNPAKHDLIHANDPGYETLSKIVRVIRDYGRSNCGVDIARDVASGAVVLGPNGKLKHV